jgi:hypothetical protein
MNKGFLDVYFEKNNIQLYTAEEIAQAKNDKFGKCVFGWVISISSVLYFAAVAIQALTQ